MQLHDLVAIVFSLFSILTYFLKVTITLTLSSSPGGTLHRFRSGVAPPSYRTFARRETCRFFTADNMGRTMQTARKTALPSQREMDQMEVVPSLERFSLPVTVKCETK